MPASVPFKKLGNEGLLQKEKTAFLCSRQVPGNVRAAVHDWVCGLSPERDCVLCGNHSSMEQQAFTWLLERKIPVVWVLAEAMRERWDENVGTALREGRMLVLTYCGDNARQASRQSAADRNRAILSMASSVVVGYCTQGGNIEKQIAGRSDASVLVSRPAVPPVGQVLASRLLPGRDRMLFLDLKMGEKAPYLEITRKSASSPEKEVLVIDYSELPEVRNTIDGFLHSRQIPRQNPAFQKDTWWHKIVMRLKRCIHSA